MNTAYSNLKRFASGFTMIELLIVIAIIAILSSIVIFIPLGSSKRARDARRESDIKQYQTAIELYSSKSGNGFYPSYTDASGKRVTGANSLCTALGLTSCPEDPINASSSTNVYLYQSDGDNSGTPVATKYVLWAKLEAATSYFVVCSNGKAGTLATVSTTTGTCPL